LILCLDLVEIAELALGRFGSTFSPVPSSFILEIDLRGSVDAAAAAASASFVSASNGEVVYLKKNPEISYELFN